MSYQTSYDTGLKPFNHDKDRGKWSRSSDFIFACIGHAFKADTILLMPVILFRQLGIYAFILYFMILTVCVVPIIFIQSFLGQFSGTGFISIFRIAPLFKGVGYVAFGLNVITLAYFSIFSALPLLSFSYILRPTIPWSCEGAKEWMVTRNNTVSPCDYNATFNNLFGFRVPSPEFFETNMDFTKHSHRAGFSWPMFLCATLASITVAFVAVRPIKTIGQFLRYSCGAVIGIMCLLLLRFLLLPGALNGLTQFLKPFNVRYKEAWAALPYVVLSTLGPGWGSIITMASFNDFKTNIYSFSWIVSFVQLAMILGITFLSKLMSGFLFTPFGQEIFDHIHGHSTDEFLFIPTGLTLMEVPRVWSLIFFAMLFLGSWNLLVVQLVSVLTTLFDEYEALRSRKKTVTLACVALLAVSSFFFCSNHGLGLIVLLTQSTVNTQVVLNLLLLLVVLWVYGRERFQRDVVFMTSRVYSSFMVTVVRFVSPLILILGICIGLIFMVINLIFHFSFEIFLFLSALTVIPWCLIPCCCCYKVMQTTGAFCLRMKRCVRPTDWYPADPVHKQRYEEAFGNSDMSFQLTIPAEEATASA